MGAILKPNKSCFNQNIVGLKFQKEVPLLVKDVHLETLCRKPVAFSK